MECHLTRIEPLFHENLLEYSVLPSGLTPNGPISSMAPTPRDEHPGPVLLQDVVIFK